MLHKVDSNKAFFSEARGSSTQLLMMGVTAGRMQREKLSLWFPLFAFHILPESPEPGP